MLNKVKNFYAWLNEPDELKPAAAALSAPIKNKAKLSPRENVAPEGFLLPVSMDELRIDAVIVDKLRVLKRSGLALPHEVWDEFVIDTVVAFGSWMQTLPASEDDHHTWRRGLLEHSLDVAIYAMRIRRNYILPPNTPPEEVIHREYIWVYGVFICALLHDSGKLFDFHIELQGGDRWTIAHGPLGELSLPHRFKHVQGRSEATQQQLSSMLLSRVVSVNPMTFIISDVALFNQMSSFLTGHHDPDNVIAQIICQANAASVAQDAGADKDGINAVAAQAKIDFCTPRASDTVEGVDEAEETTVEDHEYGSGNVESDPAALDESLLGLMDDMGSMIEGDTSSAELEGDREDQEAVERLPLCDLSLSEMGQQFWCWVRGGIVEGRLSVNTAEAHCHQINGQLFIVSEPLMKSFVAQYGVGTDAKSHIAVQQGFQSLGLHTKNQQRDLHTAIAQIGAAVYGYLLPMDHEFLVAFSAEDSVLSMEVS